MEERHKSLLRKERLFLTEHLQPILDGVIDRLLNTDVLTENMKQEIVCTYICCNSQVPGPEVIKHISCSAQLDMKFSLLINMKMPTLVGIFIFISRETFMLSYA